MVPVQCVLSIFRLHGFRLPYPENPTKCDPYELTGDANEVWSFWERIYGILKDLFFLKERMKPYIKEHMRRCCDEGIPLMRPLFFNFRSDENTYEVEDEFMFGSDVLATPICE
jgi:alpha-D-xyloside xylohydrolase